jgi:hypothetical protein
VETVTSGVAVVTARGVRVAAMALGALIALLVGVGDLSLEGALFLPPGVDFFFDVDSIRLAGFFFLAASEPFRRFPPRVLSVAFFLIDAADLPAVFFLFFFLAIANSLR